MIATSYNNPYCKLSVCAGGSKDTNRILLWYFTKEFHNIKYLQYKFSSVYKTFFLRGYPKN